MGKENKMTKKKEKKHQNPKNLKKQKKIERNKFWVENGSGERKPCQKSHYHLFHHSSSSLLGISSKVLQCFYFSQMKIMHITLFMHDHYSSMYFYFILFFHFAIMLALFCKIVLSPFYVFLFYFIFICFVLVLFVFF
jgi:hypothetical protein